THGVEGGQPDQQVKDETAAPGSKAHARAGALDDFEWRLSIADIEQPGAFSTFPGYDRYIVLLQGSQLGLHATQSQDEGRLHLPGDVHKFDGAAKITATLDADEPCRVLN